MPYFSDRFGNAASRNHAFGWEAEEAVDEARSQVARLIGAKPQEIVFLSGATEADNLAIKGAVEFYRDRGQGVVTVGGPLAVEALEGREHVLGALQGAGGVGAVPLGDAEDRQDAVTDELVDHPPVAEDDLGHGGEVPVEACDHGFGRELLGDPGVEHPLLAQAGAARLASAFPFSGSLAGLRTLGAEVCRAS